jgi:TM2 domain-containing membrane protein YozV
MNCAIHTNTPAAAFCRTCGKALCENCKREVMGAIYCEPCIAARLQSGGVPTSPAVPVTVVQGGPSPGLAALLGMIPGVGAMYNGQFVKAFIHVVIFAMLIVALSHARGALPVFFSLMLAAFWFYMVIEAYQTARARQVGQAAPDFLGLDRIFGVHEHPPAGATISTGGMTTPGQSPQQTSSHPSAPMGPIILVALGGLFLLSNLGMIHVDRMWPLILIGIGLWIAYKRTGGRD